MHSGSGRQPAKERSTARSGVHGGRGWLRVIGELLLLAWVLGVFVYFYQARGYLDLARKVLGI